MTKFTFKGDITWGSGSEARSFPVMMENQEGFEAYISKTTEAYDMAVAMLKGSIAKLDSTEDVESLYEVADHFFLTGPRPGAEDLRTIKAGLVLTLNGLLGANMAIKVGGVGAKPTVTGWVKLSTKKSTESYHNRTAYSGPGGKSGVAYRAGAVHITTGKLDQGPGHAARTVVHEATHKFMGTADYCYFNKETLAPGKAITKDQALNNADSFAWFAALAHQ